MRLVSKSTIFAFAVAAATTAMIVTIVNLTIEPASQPLTISRGETPITLLSPAWLYLIACIPTLYLLTKVSLTDLNVKQNWLQGTIRSLVIAGIAVALARPVQTTTDTKLATVVLIDVSASISDKQLADARSYLDEINHEKGEEDRLYAITFAEHPKRVVIKDNKFVVARHSHKDDTRADESTDIQAAMQLGYGLYPDGYVPRMVIISDGNQTLGDISNEAYRAHDFGVRVSWKTFPRNRTKEIRVLSLVLPGNIKQNQPFHVSAEVWSTHEEEVTLALSQNGAPNPLEPKSTVKLQEGKNTVTFKSQAKQAGFVSYRVRLVDPKNDTEKRNNAAMMTAPVTGKPQILYVEGGRARSPGSSWYLQNALEKQNIGVEVRGPRGLPPRVSDLLKYDLVIVSDIASHFIGVAQMSALENYVRNHRGGLIVAGGEDSFGSGGYQGTRMEKIMPVRFDSEKSREQPSIAIVLLIDRSGSMSGPKMEAAKASARATTEVLSRSDLIAVVAFDNRPTTIVRLQRAANRMRISSDISKLRSGGGTNIYPALREAYEVLQTANAKVKHVILLSDGQASTNGIAELCREMRSSRITVSAVGIGNADRSLLQLIASNGGGRSIMTDDLAQLPRIFMRETTEAQKSPLVEDFVEVHVAKRVDMIEGTRVGSAPTLRGYVSTKPKPKSDIVLISDLGEPLLARWRLGSGTSVAWTSDVKNRWGVDWVRWSGYSKFWAQVVRTSMRQKTYDGYKVLSKIRGRRAHILVDAIDSDDQFVNELDTELVISDPSGKYPKQTIPMKQTAAGQYAADFLITRYGGFNLTAVHRRGTQKVAESKGAVALPYPTEYLRTSANEKILRETATITGGTNTPTSKQIWQTNNETISFTKDLWPWVLLFVAFLFLIDLYTKRVRLFGYRRRSI